ncbi:unnamed protein product [Brassica oleracea]
MFVNSEKEKVSILRSCVTIKGSSSSKSNGENSGFTYVKDSRLITKPIRFSFFLVSLWSFKSEDHYCRQRHQHITPVQRYNTSAKVFS